MSHKRVDDFMKVVRERVTGQGINMAAWEHMYTRLRSILGESEEGIYLVASWSTWRRETTLAKWDCDFTEMVIDEAGVKERANADKNPQNLPRGSTLRNYDLSNIELRVGMWLADQHDAVG